MFQGAKIYGYYTKQPTFQTKHSNGLHSKSLAASKRRKMSLRSWEEEEMNEVLK
jgi:hypothetical protein